MPDQLSSPPEPNLPAPRARAWKRLRGLLILALAFVGCCGFPAATLRWKKARVADFCNEVKVGQPVAGLPDRAHAAGLKVLEAADPPGAVEKRVSVYDRWLHARWFCDVSYEAEVITKVDRSFMD